MDDALFLDRRLSPHRVWSFSEMLVILDRAETIAWTLGDSETAQRLAELSLEVREAHGLPEPAEIETE